MLLSAVLVVARRETLDPLELEISPVLSKSSQILLLTAKPSLQFLSL